MSFCSAPKKSLNERSWLRGIVGLELFGPRSLGFRRLAPLERLLVLFMLSSAATFENRAGLPEEPQPLRVNRHAEVSFINISVNPPNGRAAAGARPHTPRGLERLFRSHKLSGQHRTPLGCASALT